MAPDPPPKRKRGRPSNASKLLEHQRLGFAPTTATARPSQKRSRPRKGDENGESGSAKRRKSGAGRSSLGDQDGNARRTSQVRAAATIGRRGVPQPNQPGSFGAKDARRRRSSQMGQDPDDKGSAAVSSPPQSPPKSYTHVAPHVRRVRQSAIEAKWSALGGASLTAASTTLQLAQRPILQRLSDSQLRREHTASALRLITERISRKIARGLPFPPASMPAPVGRAPLQSDGGREVELNFESVLDGKTTLERQLEPALDGLEVLQREKDTMEEELERDYETLRNLEAGARAQAREQRSLLKKAHVLTPSVKTSQQDQAQDPMDRDDGFVFDREDANAASAFTDLSEDEELYPLATQLSSHVDSISTNLEQTSGILPQLARSRAALRAVLARHLNRRAYEQTVLG